MLHMLQSFATLSLLSGIMLTLLPEGSLRRTASMAVGLLMLTLWADGLTSLFTGWFAESPLPQTALTSTGTSLADAAEAAQDTILSIWEVEP